MLCRIVLSPDSCQGRSASADVCDEEPSSAGLLIELRAGHAGIQYALSGAVMGCRVSDVGHHLRSCTLLQLLWVPDLPVLIRHCGVGAPFQQHVESFLLDACPHSQDRAPHACQACICQGSTDAARHRPCLAVRLEPRSEHGRAGQGRR